MFLAFWNAVASFIHAANCLVGVNFAWLWLLPGCSPFWRAQWVGSTHEDIMIHDDMLHQIPSLFRCALIPPFNWPAQHPAENISPFYRGIYLANLSCNHMHHNSSGPLADLHPCRGLVVLLTAAFAPLQLPPPSPL